MGLKRSLLHTAVHSSLFCHISLMKTSLRLWYVTNVLAVSRCVLFLSMRGFSGHISELLHKAIWLHCHCICFVLLSVFMQYAPLTVLTKCVFLRLIPDAAYVNMYTLLIFFFYSTVCWCAGNCSDICKTVIRRLMVVN